MDDVSVLHSQSRARKTPFPAWDPLVLARVEHIRLLPPDGLQRTPGPKAILYYLPRDAEVRERGCRLPRSTSTIWKFLTRLGLLSPVPQKNAFVERYHRNYKYECLLVHMPQSLEEVRRVTEQYQQHYNWERPHQGRACGNQPPRQAFPILPTLPPLPEVVQADRWLWRYHHRIFARLIGSDGCVTVHHET